MSGKTIDPLKGFAEGEAAFTHEGKSSAFARDNVLNETDIAAMDADPSVDGLDRLSELREAADQSLARASLALEDVQAFLAARR